MRRASALKWLDREWRHSSGGAPQGEKASGRLLPSAKYRSTGAPSQSQEARPALTTLGCPVTIRQSVLRQDVSKLVG